MYCGVKTTAVCLAKSFPGIKQRWQNRKKRGQKKFDPESKWNPDPIIAVHIWPTILDINPTLIDCRSKPFMHIITSVFSIWFIFITMGMLSDRKIIACNKWVRVQCYYSVAYTMLSAGYWIWWPPCGILTTYGDVGLEPPPPWIVEAALDGAIELIVSIWKEKL